MRPLAEKVVDCCRTLATFTEESGRITRTFLSPPMRDVHRVLAAWMSELGLMVSVDAVGNLRGIRAAAESAAPRLLIGSHLDTVRDAGAYDGILGVVAGVALMEAACALRLPFEVEVIGFSEEEGVRFGVPFLGSRALAGTLDQAIIDRIAPALREFDLDPEDLPQARLRSGSFGYLEIHIEQGPVLDHLDLPLGVVESIAGQSRLTVSFRGQANHAGTTPPALRKDALAAAAEWISLVERYASTTARLVATVGALELQPNVSNVVPGAVEASLDVRHPCDARRHAAVRDLLAGAQQVGDRRGIAVSHHCTLDQAAVAMNALLVAQLAEAVQRAGYPVHRMSSGAGHDAMIMASVVPTCMLFVRSPGGISHHPAESVRVQDLEAALRAGMTFLEALEVTRG